MIKLKNYTQLIEKGFTLIELLIVITIIAVLATFAIISFTSTQSKARDAQRKSDIKNIQTALRLYFNDYGTYPANNAGFAMMACGATCNQSCSWGSTWSCGNQTYMNVIPKDPKGVNYHYTFVDKDNYVLDACLENGSDASAVAGGAWCTNNSKNVVFELKP